MKIKQRKFRNLINKKFGRWTVIKKAETIKHKTMWLCKCSCGTEKKVYVYNLITGKTISCGCKQKEIIGNLNKGKSLSKETKRKISLVKKEKYSGKNHPRYGIELTSETKNKISDSLKIKYKEDPYLWANRPKLFGEDNPNWNPNLTDKDRQHTRKYLDYILWRKKVYERDGYTCQLCTNNIGGNLTAHHIESYSSNKKLRTKVSNGVTLCEKCHKKFHSFYGYGNNIKKQFEEFKKSYNHAH